MTSEEHNWAKGIYAAHALLGLDVEAYLKMTPALLSDLMQAAADVRSGKAANEPVKVQYVDQIPDGW